METYWVNLHVQENLPDRLVNQRNWLIYANSYLKTCNYFPLKLETALRKPLAIKTQIQRENIAKCKF